MTSPHLWNGEEPRRPVLSVQGVVKRFGGVAAVDGVDLTVASNEVRGVIGPNGAGKSTLIGLLSGAHGADAGRIELDGVDVTRLAPHHRARMGVGRTHQVPRGFARMSVLENLLIGQYNGAKVRSSRRAHEACQSVLDRTGLARLAHTQVGALQLFDRKRLEVARALAMAPRLLLLDESGAGLVGREVDDFIELVRSLCGEVAAIVLVEHVMDIVTACCDRVTVVEFGKVIAEGVPSEVMRDERVVASYLGTVTQEPLEPNMSTESSDTSVAVTTSELPPAPTPAPDLDRRVSAENATLVLALDDARVSYGGVHALRGVSMAIHRGEVVALLGANGAGKTTLAHAVSGSVKLDSGTIHFEGHDLRHMPPHAIARMGVAHCMEGRRIFATLTLEENLLLAADGDRLGRERLAAVYEIFPELSQKRKLSGGSLSGGQQQMLAIGRSLMRDPRLILFDEISLGLAPIVTQRLYETLHRVRESGISMLVIEQNVEQALGIADWVYVLAHGEVRLAGHPRDVKSSGDLSRLYLGEDASSGDG